MATGKEGARERAARLLLKAVRTLPEKEQALVMQHLLVTVLRPAGGPDPATVTGWRSVAIDPVTGKRHVVLAPVIEAMKSLRASGAQVPGEQQMVPVRFSTDQYESLKEWCAEHNFSMAVVIRGLVERFLDDQQRQAS